MKFDAFMKIAASDFDFRRLGEGGEKTIAVMINSLNIDLDIKGLKEVIQKRKQNSVIMLVVADFLSSFH